MKFTKVQSSNVAGLSYNAGNKTLIVGFKDGNDRYAYRGVPANVATRMVNAPSVGKFLNSVVKPNYPARKL